nr:glycine N-methyltransferase-like [Lytechinus pictus]
MLKPGGILVLDHRNMDVIMDQGQPINKNIYYEQNAIGGLTTTITPEKPDVVNVTYDMLHCGQDAKSDKIIHKVTVPLQAICTQLVTKMLSDVFGDNCNHALYMDLKTGGSSSETAYFQHVVVKQE